MRAHRQGIPASHAFSNQKSTEHWFGTQPREVAITLAARAALRALPLLVAEWGRPGFDVLPFLRIAQATWTCARTPNVRTRAAVRTALQPISENSDAGSAVTLAAAATLPGNPNNVAEFAARAIGAAVRADSTIADDTLTELMLIEGGDSYTARGEVASVLANTKLWQDEIALAVANAWGLLKSRMLLAGDDWDVWVNWYEARLAGRPSISEEFDIAVATLPNDLWQQGPKAVNARIKELIVEHTPAALPIEERLPAQVARAAVFQPEPSGVIGLAPPTPADRLADTSEVRDLYAEVREKLDNLIALGRNMMGDRLDRSSDKLRSRMPQEISEAVERLVWSSGNTLRSILAGHDAIAGDRDPHPDKLDQGVVERLRDAVDTFNQLAIADPALRLRDAGRPGPREHGRTLDEINIVIEVSTEAAADRNITTVAAGEQLSENAAIVIEAGSSLTERLAVELARDTNRNFVAGVVVSVYRMLRNLPALSRGEGGFISKEYFSGFYKYAGGATVVALAGGVSGAYSIRWEIVEFIVSHADQFRLYAAYAFEQSPGLKQTSLSG